MVCSFYVQKIEKHYWGLITCETVDAWIPIAALPHVLADRFEGLDVARSPLGDVGRARVRVRANENNCATSSPGRAPCRSESHTTPCVWQADYTNDYSKAGGCW